MLFNSLSMRIWYYTNRSIFSILVPLEQTGVPSVLAYLWTLLALRVDKSYFYQFPIIPNFTLHLPCLRKHPVLFSGQVQMHITILILKSRSHLRIPSGLSVLDPELNAVDLCGFFGI